MRVTMASVAARTGRANEDHTGAVPTAVVLLDGAGIPGTASICRHGVAWYTHSLGGTLLGLLSLVPDRSLPALLATAIDRVTAAHRDTCDVSDPISPSATVAILRVSDGVAEHLVLGDTVVVLDRAHHTPFVVTDPREVTISRSYLPALAAAEDGDTYRRVLDDLRAHRNRPGGFWLAKDDPRAADEAITGSCPAEELTAAALLSNGAARLVDRFSLASWPEVMATLASGGPASGGPASGGPASGGPALGGAASSGAVSGGPGEIIRRVREAEQRYALTADDATIAYCTDFTDA